MKRPVHIVIEDLGSRGFHLWVNGRLCKAYSLRGRMKALDDAQTIGVILEDLDFEIVAEEDYGIAP